MLQKKVYELELRCSITRGKNRNVDTIDVLKRQAYTIFVYYIQVSDLLVRKGEGEERESLSRFLRERGK